MDGYAKFRSRSHDAVIRVYDDVDAGTPVTKKDLKKLKIIRLDDDFSAAFSQMHTILHHSILSAQRLYGEQYQIRVEALLRGHGEDVTSQIISAYDKTIKHRLKDYLPKREELIKARRCDVLLTGSGVVSVMQAIPSADPALGGVGVVCGQHSIATAPAVTLPLPWSLNVTKRAPSGLVARSL